MASKSQFWSSISVDSKLDLMADEATITYPTDVAMDLVNSGLPQRSKITLSLNDAQTQALELYAMEAKLDLQIGQGSSPNIIQSHLICHDNGWKLNKGWFKKLYTLNPLKDIFGNIQIPKDDNDEKINHSIGKKTAKEVLEEALAANNTGIYVSWSAPDYDIINLYHQSQLYDTSLTSLISELISPINFSERNSVYAYLDENILHIAKTDSGNTAGGCKIDTSHIKSISISKELVLKPPINKVIVESYKKKLLNTNEIKGTPITSRTFNTAGDMLSMVVTTPYTVLGVATKDEVLTYKRAVNVNPYANLQGNITYQIYLVSKEETIYTYDKPPESLEDDMFVPYRKIIRKIRTLTQYEPTLDMTEYAKEIILTIYGYNDHNELVEELEQTEHYRQHPYAFIGIGFAGVLKPHLDTVPYKTSAKQTSHRQIKVDVIETSIREFVNDKFVGGSSVQQISKLDSPELMSENENTSINYEKEFTKIVSTGNENFRTVKLSSDLLTKTQLINGAHEIIKDTSYLKISISINMIPMAWIKKGTHVSFSGVLPVTYYLGSSSGVAKLDSAIDLETLADTSLKVESQNYQINENGEASGVLNLVGYRYFSSGGGGAA